MGCFVHLQCLCRAITVEPLALLGMTAITLLFEGQQLFLHFKLCMMSYNDTGTCYNLSAFPDEEDKIQSETSRWMLYGDILSYAPSLPAMLVLGAWSDRIGRKPPLILACVGGVILGIVSLVSAVWIHLPMPVMLLGWACFGITASQGMLIISVLSYVADISTLENRVMRIGIVESMIAIGSVLGLVLGGLLPTLHLFPLMYVAFLSLFLLSMLYTIFCLRETRALSPAKSRNDEASTNDNQKKNDDETDPLISTQEAKHPAVSYSWEARENGHSSSICGKLFHCGMWGASLVVCARKRPGRQRLILALVIICSFLHYMTLYGFQDVIVLHATKAPLYWSPLLIGACAAVVGTGSAVLLLIILPLARRLNIGNNVVAALSLVLLGIGNLLMAVAGSTTAVWLATIPFYVIELVITIYDGIVSTLVSPDEQGRALSLVIVMGTLAHLLAGVIFDNLYPATLHVLSGGVSFLVLSGSSFIELCLFLFAAYNLKYHRA